MSEFTPAVSREILEKRIARVEKAPLHEFLGIRVPAYGPGHATMILPVGPNIVNPAGVLHGGIMYAMLDVTCYCAACSLWDEEHNGVSNNIHVQMLRSGGAHEIEIKSSVIKRGRNLIFGESEAHAGGKLLARASITKSIIRVK